MTSNIQNIKNLDGSKEKVLRIECRNCYLYKKGFIDSKKCYYCLFNHIKNNVKNRFSDIYIESLNDSIPKSATLIFKDYFKQTKRIGKIRNRIIELREKECIYSDFSCKLPDSKKLFLSNEGELLDPIETYINLSSILNNLESFNIQDSNCINCKEEIRSYLIDILDIFESTLIVNSYNSFQGKKPLYFYEYIITKSHSPEKVRKSSNVSYFHDFSKDSERELIDTYTTQNEIYRVNIFTLKEMKEKYYEYYLNYEKTEKSYYTKIVTDILNKIELLYFDEIVDLETLIKLYKKEVIRILENNYTIDSDMKEKLSLYITIQYINLGKIFPLLIDDFIEEIFLDGPDGAIYLNHQRFGRCRSSILFNRDDIERIITLLRLYSGQKLDYSTPTLKCVIKNKYFYSRFSIDIKPINVADYSLDIRKLDKNILNVQDLLKFNTLSPDIASFLYFCILLRVNITVTGETDTGKTTLINALDFISPLEFRKIYVENIVESLDQFTFGKHQLKFHADALEDNENGYTKSKHIKTLLHRTPDIIFLGEILTEEQSKALFHCLEAGLKGFQTIHSNSISSLLRRFLDTFHITKSQLDDLGLVILMSRDQERNRRIVSIVEIDTLNHSFSNFIQEIFKYNPTEDKWELKRNLYELKTVKNLCKYESISEKKFIEYFTLYSDIFEFLANSRKISNQKLIQFFTKLSYYSSNPMRASNFWEDWKKNNKFFVESNNT